MFALLFSQESAGTLQRRYVAVYFAFQLAARRERHEVKLKKGAEVEVHIQADKSATTPKST